MRIRLNGKEIETKACMAFDFSGDDKIIILNGFQITKNRELKENDDVCVIKKGVMPSREELEVMLSARHTPGIYTRLKNSKVGIAGLGGLGSNTAVLLTRVGIGTLVLADYDVVEPSNLNRQHYTIAHLGMAKTLALKKQLLDINPFIRIETHLVKITAKNACKVFEGCSVVVEAFDDPVCKAELVECLAVYCKIVAASGMAGIESANSIHTNKRLKNLYVCGDMETEACEGIGLMAPRVAVCAGHQANMAVRLLLGLEQA